jgi:hypothetical protein
MPGRGFSKSVSDERRVAPADESAIGLRVCGNLGWGFYGKLRKPNFRVFIAALSVDDLRLVKQYRNYSSPLKDNELSRIALPRGCFIDSIATALICSRVPASGWTSTTFSLSKTKRRE